MALILVRLEDIEEDGQPAIDLEVVIDPPLTESTEPTMAQRVIHQWLKHLVIAAEAESDPGDPI